MKIVGIGTSAGGLQALADMLPLLPADQGAVYVILQHLSTDHPSIMDQLLAKHTRMPVSVVSRITIPEPNHIYLKPADRDLVLENHSLNLLEREAEHSLPIDRFFSSLSRASGVQSIAIILSGAGTDGTRGVRHIKERGGVVLVQSPDSAQFDGMPGSVIRLGMADAVDDPASLARKVQFLLDKGISPETVEEVGEVLPSDTFNRLIQRIQEFSGIDFRQYRKSTLYRRMEKRMLLQQFENLEDYLQNALSDEQELARLQKDFLIGVTSFFRDPEMWKLVHKEVLPRLLDENREQPLRIWIPACSTGEEAYSLALCIEEYLQGRRSVPDYKIFATDVDRSAIKLAIEGAYPTSAAAEIPPGIVGKYLIRSGDHLRIDRKIRDNLLFAVQNVLQDPPFINMDLIICRNLLIYLTPAAQKKVLSTLHFALRSEGLLILGPSESLGEVKNAFYTLDRRWNIFQKIENARIKLTPHRISSRRLAGTLQEPGFTAAEDEIQLPPEPSIDPYSIYLAERHAPPAVFVNAAGQLLYINGELDHLFRLPRAMARLTLESTLRPREAALLQAGVDRALSGDDSVRYEKVTLPSVRGDEMEYDLRMFAVHLDNNEEDLVLIEFHSGGTGDAFDEQPVTGRPGTRLQDRLRQMESQLRTAERRARQLRDELEATNEELQSANRELLASNEELQSTNEELQSVNEELYTVNSELQLKNEQLTNTSNDVSNLLKSIDIGTIFLDRDLRIRRFTPAIRHQFDLQTVDIGRPITSFSSAFRNLDIGAISRQVFDSLRPYEEEITDSEGNQYLMRVLPYRTEKDVIGGLVVTFININELTETRQQLSTLGHRFQAIFHHSDNVILVVDSGGIISQMNRPMGRLGPMGNIGRPLYELLSRDERSRVRKKLEEVLSTGKSRRMKVAVPGMTDEQVIYEMDIIPGVEQERRNGPVPYAILILRNITAQERERSALQNLLRGYESFMDNANHQIALIDREGYIQHINFTRFTGKSPRELEGQNVYDWIPDDQLAGYRQAIEEVFEGKAYNRFRLLFPRQDGERVETEIFITPVIVNNAIEHVAIIGDHTQDGEQEKTANP